MHGGTTPWDSFVGGMSGARAPSVWLLTSPEQVAVQAFAHRAAAWLLTGADTAAALALSQSIARREHPGVFTLAREVSETARKADAGDAALTRNITVAQVRMMAARLHTRSDDGERRIIIIDRIDDCEAGAANALLKLLEEPPDSALFLLLSCNPGRLLPTIRSRCRLLRVKQSLQAASGGDTAESAGNASMAVAMVAAVEGIIGTGDPTGSEREALARTMAGAANREQFRQFLDHALRACHARAETGDARRRAAAIAAYDDVGAIAARAIALADDQVAASFAVGNVLARMAGS